MALPPSSPVSSKYLVTGSPEKWYPLEQDSKGRIKVALTPSGQKAEKVIYIFKNKSTDCSLIGMTGQKVCKRVAQYQTKFNQHCKRQRSQFCEEVKEHPFDFNFGILHRLKEQEDLAELERTYLSAHHTEVYNKNKGGGGSAITTKVALADFNPLTLKLQKMTAEEIKENIPSKSYALVRNPATGRLRFQLTPKGRKKRGLIYGITDGKQWMVGKTEQELRQRMYGYHHLFVKNTHFLAKDVNDHPQSFQLKILYEGSSGTELSEAEKIYIQALDSVNHGYNTNQGGGGGSAQRQIKRQLF